MIKKTLAVVIAATLITGCEEDNSDLEVQLADLEQKVEVLEQAKAEADAAQQAADEAEALANAPKFVLPFKEAGDSETEYLISSDDISQGELSAAGNGFEQIGWNFFYEVANTVFVSGYEDFKTVSYRLNDESELVQLSTFAIDAPLEVFGSVGNTLLATGLPRDGAHTPRTLFSVDAHTGFVTGKTNFTIHSNNTGTVGEGTISAPTALVFRDNELYVPFQKLDDAGFYTTPDADKAYVAIYDYPLTDGAVPKKIIEDDRTSNIGVNGVTTGLIKTHSGDLYSFSNGSADAGFSPASTKPSGILKIAQGESEFDANYFFDIDAATSGGTIFWFDYIGGDKAIARIITSKIGGYAWSAYYKSVAEPNTYVQKLVIIDLASQTITDVAGVPLHQKRYSSPIEVVGGKVYVSIETADENAIYEVDIDSATAVKGATFAGKTIKGVFDLNN